MVMVTNPMEGCKKKCEVYWPNEIKGRKDFGSFNITLTAQQVLADYTVRTLQLEVSI